MTPMIEKQVTTAQNELQKLNARLERAEKAYAKKLANAEKLNVANMTNDEHRAWLDTVPTTQDGWILSKEDIKRNGAWFDLIHAKSNLAEVKEAIEKASKKLADLTNKAEGKAEQNAKAERITRLESEWLAMTAEERKAEYEKWLEAFKAECLKDGIVIEYATRFGITGTTAKGHRFAMQINNGFTQRSWHCYTLTVNGQTIFTSGDFSTAYNCIKK